MKQLRLANNRSRLISIENIFEHVRIPKNDFRGSKAIMANIKRILKDGAAYSKLLAAIKEYLLQSDQAAMDRDLDLYDGLSEESLSLAQVKNIIMALD